MLLKSSIRTGKAPVVRPAQSRFFETFLPELPMAPAFSCPVVAAAGYGA